MRKPQLLIPLFSLVFLAGCQATGEEYAANVYRADQVNSKQQAKTVQILAVMPAKIEVDNTEQKKTAQVAGAIGGALLGGALGNSSGSSHRGAATAGGAVVGGAGGAAAGSLVKDKVLVDGVSLTYVEDGNTLNSAQVGRACEFKPGVAIVVSTSATETRIQPNASCPVEKK